MSELARNLVTGMLGLFISCEWLRRPSWLRNSGLLESQYRGASLKGLENGIIENRIRVGQYDFSERYHIKQKQRKQREKKDMST